MRYYTILHYTIPLSSVRVTIFYSLFYYIVPVGMLSAAEETDAVLSRVSTFLRKGESDIICLPWEDDHRNHLQLRAARVRAIEEHLGLLPNGLFVPLTLRQHVTFGTPLAKLQYKISKARRQSNDVIQKVNDKRHANDDEKDIALLREFILECLSPFKRFTLERCNSAFDKPSASPICWLFYILSWLFVSGSLLFFLYWIFAWGVYEGDEILRAWGAVFGTGAVSDILLVQITKIMLLYYLPAAAMQPQLLRIRSVLADVSMNYINRHRRAYSLDSVAEGELINVVQHMSASCRASRSNELNALPAAWLLRQVRN